MLKNYIKSRPLLLKLIRPFLWFRSRWSKSRKPSLHWEAIVGGEIVLRVGNIPGQFRLSAGSDLAKRVLVDGNYEPEVTSALERLAHLQGVIVDVGANVGLYASFFAHKFKAADKIIAVEANPEAFRLLSLNMGSNLYSERVELVNACIGATRTFVDLSFVDGKPEYSSVGGIVHPAIRPEDIKSVRIPQVSLDEIIGGRQVSLIFVDVEGAEEMVFRGAEALLREKRPILFFECSDILLRKFGSSSEHLERYLENLGYRVSDPLLNGSSLKHPCEGEAIAYPVQK